MSSAMMKTTFGRRGETSAPFTASGAIADKTAATIFVLRSKEGIVSFRRSGCGAREDGDDIRAGDLDARCGTRTRPSP